MVSFTSKPPQRLKIRDPIVNTLYEQVLSLLNDVSGQIDLKFRCDSKKSQHYKEIRESLERFMEDYFDTDNF